MKKPLLDLAAVVLAFLGCEAGFRLASGVPVFADANFRSTRAVAVALNHLTQYDPLLGWTLVPHYSSTGPGGDGSFNTIEHGIRKNGPDTAIGTGGTLVVGGSFAAGSGLRDGETWPAALERMRGAPVFNAAVGNYALDQVVLRAEQLLPLVKPKTLIVEALSTTVQWSGFSSLARPKPYFTVEDGRLVHRNAPVPRFAPSQHETTRLKDALGHSIVIDNIMGKLAPDAWYASSRDVITRIQNDDVEVACKLLARLKGLTDRHGTRLLLLAHAIGSDVAGHEGPPANLRFVSECAEEASIQVAETFPAFKALEQADAAGFRTYFIMHGDVYGHMSAKGSLEIAKVLSEALARPAPDGEIRTRESAGGRASAAGTAGSPEDAASRVTSIGPLYSASCRIRSRAGSDRIRITAAGGRGLHHAASVAQAVADGPASLSFDVRPERASGMWVQVLQGEDGVRAEIDFERPATATLRLGRTRHLTAKVEPLSHGWFRVSVGGTLPGGPTSVTFHILGPDGGLEFEPNGQAIVLSRIELRSRQAEAQAAAQP